MLITIFYVETHSYILYDFLRILAKAKSSGILAQCVDFPDDLDPKGVRITFGT